MEGVEKYLWLILGLALAGIVGYGIASISIKDLNKRVLDAAQELGGVQKETERLAAANEKLEVEAERLAEANRELERVRQDLVARSQTIESELANAEKGLDRIASTNAGQLIGIIETLAASPDVQSLGSAVQILQQNALSQCQIQIEATWASCSPRQVDNKMPAVSSGYTPVGGGEGGWSAWQIASDWNGAPWNCIRARLKCLSVAAAGAG